MKVKQQVSTPLKIKAFFTDEVTPSGSHLDAELLKIAFGILKRRYGSDFDYYIKAEAWDWARLGESQLSREKVDELFKITQPDAAKKRVKVDAHAGMSPIAFDAEWVDCGGPRD